MGPFTMGPRPAWTETTEATIAARHGCRAKIACLSVSQIISLINLVYQSAVVWDASRRWSGHGKDQAVRLTIHSSTDTSHLTLALAYEA